MCNEMWLFLLIGEPLPLHEYVHQLGGSPAIPDADLLGAGFPTPGCESGAVHIHLPSMLLAVLTKCFLLCLLVWLFAFIFQENMCHCFISAFQHPMDISPITTKPTQIKPSNCEVNGDRIDLVEIVRVLVVLRLLILLINCCSKSRLS